MGGARDGVVVAVEAARTWTSVVQIRSARSAVRWRTGTEEASTATVPVARRQARQCVSTGQPSSVCAKDSSATPAHTAARTSTARTTRCRRTSRLRTKGAYTTPRPRRPYTQEYGVGRAAGVLVEPASGAGRPRPEPLRRAAGGESGPPPRPGLPHEVADPPRCLRGQPSCLARGNGGPPPPPPPPPCRPAGAPPAPLLPPRSPPPP